MSMGGVELRSVIKFGVGLGKSPVETLKLIRSSETMDPGSPSSTSGMKYSGMEENQPRTIRGMVGPAL